MLITNLQTSFKISLVYSLTFTFRSVASKVGCNPEASTKDLVKCLQEVQSASNGIFLQMKAGLMYSKNTESNYLLVL